MSLRLLLLPFFLLYIVASCREPNQEIPQEPTHPKPPSDTTVITDAAATYLALGDSYTIGERVEEAQRWPLQLADSLTKSGDTVSTTIIARTGWTTSELQTGIAQAGLTDTFDMVSLLIGVNNQYRGQSLSRYETEFAELLQSAIGFAGGRADKVFVLSIPDYGVTPFAVNRDTVKIREEIDAFNSAHQAICDTMGVRWFDITGISREAREQAVLVAEDGLHPSGEMYRRWVQLILPDVRDLFRKL